MGAALALGIDPGASSGWALVTVAARPALISSGRVRLDRGETPTFALQAVLASAPSAVAHVAIESQFVAKNIRTSLRLAQSAGRWEEAAAALLPGVAIAWVSPAGWQAAVLRGIMGGQARRDERKASSAAACRMRWGKDLEGDVADAACIAAWAAEAAAFAQRLR